MLKGKVFWVLFFLLFINHSIKAQQDTTRGTYKSFKPDDIKQEEVTGDSSIQVAIYKQKPVSILGKVLYYLSPTKYTLKRVAVDKPSLPGDSSFILPESNHRTDYKNNKIFGNKSEKEWDRIKGIRPTKIGGKALRLRKIVYGYHPHWMGAAYKYYNFSLLSRVAYFSYELNPKTGNYKTIHNWRTTELIKSAHQYGCKVDLSVSNFGKHNNRIFLTNQRAQLKLVDSLISLIKLRNADGVNINFEEVPAMQKQNFTAFVMMLSKKIDSVSNRLKNKEYKLSLTIPAVDWRNAYDVGALKEYVDYFFLMGYDFYGKYSPVAGPVSLLFSGKDWSENNINSTINYYLEIGVPPSSLILGLPYYGNEWETETGEIPSKSKKFVQARTYSFMRDSYSDTYVKKYDSTSHSYYYIYSKNDKWYQCWTDDVKSLSMKYDYVLGKNIGGVGIWALGYDNGYTDLWELLKRKFAAMPDTTEPLHSRVSKSLSNSVSQNTIDELSKTEPQYINRFDDKLSKSFRVFVLIFALLVFFAVIGFIIAISDYDIRFVLFDKEFRVYLFFVLLLILVIFVFRTIDIISTFETKFIITIALGIFAVVIVLNISKLKKEKQGEKRP